MGKDREIVWVEKGFAEKLKALENAQATREQQIEVFDEYIKKVCEESRREFKANLESLEEDIAIYTGLMLRVKQAFEKAKNEQITASYDLWEKFEKEIPSVREKTQKIIDTLKPLKDELKEIDGLIGKISTYNIDKFGQSIALLGSLHGKNKDMVEFLMLNFKESK